MGLAGALFFIPNVTYKTAFLSLVMIATLLPDIDSMNSIPGKHWYLRPLQWTTKHRGLLHSFTFCTIVSFGFAFIIPVMAFPFFLGYVSHLMGDAMTEEGIRPWWPFRKEIEGFFRTGKMTEKVIFWGLVVICVVIVLKWLLH